MRSCIAALAIALLAANPVREVKNMSEIVVQDVRVTFSGPSSLPLPVVTRGNPAYDAPRNFFTVSLKNESDKTKKLPLPEITQGCITKYRNPDTGAEFVDNRTPPPRLDGAVEALAPGQTKSFQVVFEYQPQIAERKNGGAVIQFCAVWNRDWLRKAAYTAGAYNWNESFELCREVQILDE